jgi:hypothetical protein
MDTLRRTGVPGRKKNTGISMEGKNGMVTRKMSIKGVRAEAKANKCVIVNFPAGGRKLPPAGNALG